MKLSAPWYNFYHELEALFAQDQEVRVVFEEEAMEIKLYVEGARKADALSQLLPVTREFGNVTVKVTVVPANEVASSIDLLSEAFEGNPALSYVRHVDSMIGSFDYAVFQNRVVQYFNDDMGDINGNRSTLYQDIAKDVFGDRFGVFFCTEAPPSMTKPLGEWP